MKVPVENLTAENKGFIGIMLNFNQSGSAWRLAPAATLNLPREARRRPRTACLWQAAGHGVRHRLVDMAMRINVVKSTLELLVRVRARSPWRSACWHPRPRP
jgi:acyl-CoA dehydrogenase